MLHKWSLSAGFGNPLPCRFTFKWPPCLLGQYVQLKKHHHLLSFLLQISVCRVKKRSSVSSFVTFWPVPFLSVSSSIEGEYVPIEGDEVSYKLCSIPPKHEKVQAVEVTITHLKPGTKHETWAGRVVSSWALSPAGGGAEAGGKGQREEIGRDGRIMREDF